MTPLPFTLAPTQSGTWHAFWSEPRIRILVAGDAAAPDAACIATLASLVDAWARTVEVIAAYLRALPPETRVVLEASDWGAFAAGDCGFFEELRFEAIVVNDTSATARASITFYTGFPDGYATYRIVLESGAPVALTAFAS